MSGEQWRVERHDGTTDGFPRWNVYRGEEAGFWLEDDKEAEALAAKLNSHAALVQVLREGVTKFAGQLSESGWLIYHDSTIAYLPGKLTHDSDDPCALCTWVNLAREALRLYAPEGGK